MQYGQHAHIAYTRIYVYTHMYVHTRARARARAHTHTHTHTHIYMHIITSLYIKYTTKKRINVVNVS